MDFRKYSFSQRTVNEWNKLSADCVHYISIIMFKNIQLSHKGRNQRRIHLDSNMWTLDKPMTSLSKAINDNPAILCSVKAGKVM